MSKRTNTPVEIEIDQDYEAQVNRLSAVDGHTSDHAIEPRRPQRPAQPVNYVPASPVPNRARRVSGAQLVQASQTINTAARPDDGGALQAMESMSEKSTPVQRGLGFGIVGLVFLALTAVVSFAMYMAGAPTSAAWTLFGMGALITVLIAYTCSEEYSPAGVERFKARMYTRIRGAEIASDERVNMAKLELLRDMQKELDSDE